MEDQDQDATRQCPLCAEPVKSAAVVCPHCQGRLQSALLKGTYRNRPGRQIAGVAIALAEELGVSVTFIRLLFVILTFINLLGPAIYVTMWLVLPAEPGGVSLLGRCFAAVPGDSGERSIFERLLERLRTLCRRLGEALESRRKKSTEPPNGPDEAAEGMP
jgi:phage shock protein PspC (stress-responsive transcriptional regulator)